MNQFYKVIEAITNELASNELIQTVTVGDIDAVDLDKTSNYSLAHIIVNNATLGKVYTFDFSVILMDIVDEDKETGFDNTQDVLNSMIVVAGRLKESLLRGTLYDMQIQLSGDSASVEMFVDRFSDKVAGVTMSFSLIMPNTIGIC